MFVVLEERKLYLSWKDCVFLWNAEERTGDCIFFLFSVLVKRNKYCSINLWRTDVKLLKLDGCSSITFFFFFLQVQFWSFVCVARKQLHLYCVVFSVLIWLPVSQVSKKERRVREVQGSFNSYSSVVTKHRIFLFLL